MDGLGFPLGEADLRRERESPAQQGENDEFGSGEAVQGVLSKLGSHITLVRVAGADHYCASKLDELRAAVRGYFESGPGARIVITSYSIHYTKLYDHLPSSVLTRSFPPASGR